MYNELEKLDLLRERFNLSYKEAKEALELAGGDLVQALITLEEEQSLKINQSKFEERGREVVGQLKAAWRRSKKTKIKLKKGDKTVLEIPAPLGALGVLGALASAEIAVIGFLGAATAMAKKYSIELDRKKYEDEDLEVELAPEERIH